MNPAFAYRKVEADEDFVRKTAYFGKCIGSPLRASVGLTISMNLRLRTLVAGYWLERMGSNATYALRSGKAP